VGCNQQDVTDVTSKSTIKNLDFPGNAFMVGTHKKSENSGKYRDSSKNIEKKRCWPTSSQDLYITCNIGVKTSKTDAIRSNPGDLQVELAIMFPYLCTTHGGTQKALVPV
jgi:hypothetical protein